MGNNLTGYITILILLGGCIADINTKFDSNLITNIEFREFHSDYRLFSLLHINFENKSFQLYHSNELHKDSFISQEQLTELLGVFEDLKESDMNRIYNTNSSDHPMFQIRFWSKNSSFNYVIESYGHEPNSVQVKAVLNKLRALNKQLGR